MGYIVAVTGKGGVGKTTLSGLIVRRLVELGQVPVLAVDADPNSCLDSVLGVRVLNTIGSVREETRQIAEKGMAAGISKNELLQIKTEQSLVESNGFDLISMGRPEGPGCYCYANNVLKSVITEIYNRYPFIVLDNEAGLENLSRRIVQKVDMLVMVTDPSNMGMETLKRLFLLAREMQLKYSSLAIVINRLRSSTSPCRTSEIRELTSADLILELPWDDELAGLAEEGENLWTLRSDNAILYKVDLLLESTKVNKK